ncbi:MAG: 2-amino-4-hydroxy-6-hydroxymethyldihydropteridine diphosphokinase [candidate division WOR-3 bacterium]|nr:2-amino-4-hydroxy-6-hydroxymethyldihydropteridine diphosphokinase [candidate division WOR-3 bacterium]
MARIYLGLGSNLNDREYMIKRAIQSLNRHNINVIRISPIYETEPINDSGNNISVLPKTAPTTSAKFLNCVALAETLYEPEVLLKVINDIENNLGRKRKEGIRNLPRTIDIDILFYDDRIIDTPNLKIPHTALHKRAFVLIPLFDLNPELFHPVIKKTVKDLLKSVDKKGVVLWQSQPISTRI